MNVGTGIVGSGGKATPSRTGVILVTGVMAAGKSTVAQMLAESFPRAVHVRGDAFRRFVVSGRVEPSPAMPDEALNQLMLRYRLAAATADAYARAGFLSVMQDIIVGRLLAQVVGMFTAPELFVVVLDPEPDAIRTRESGRTKAGYVGGWTPADLVAEFRSTTPRIGLWLDTTELDPLQTVGAILERIDDARVATR